MEIDWIIFHKEGDSIHYLFNGSECINVMPGPDKEGCWNNNLPMDKALIEAYKTPRKKLMVIDKIRYNIVDRGTFKDYEDGI